MTLYGIDVSSHQGPLSGGKIADEGFTYAIIKATQGSGYINPHMGQQTETLRRPGLEVAQYHFLEFGDGHGQAEHYARTADLTLPCAIDVEVDPETRTMPTWQDVLDFRAYIAPLVPSVGIYLNEPDWRALGSPDLTDWDWVWKATYPYSRRGYASVLYNLAPDWGWGPLGGRTPDIWQFASTALVAEQEMDANAFRGSRDQLVSLWQRGATTERTPRVEKVLDYPRNQITQDTYYNCGPATAQTIIAAATGQMIPESDLAADLGTDEDGTDYVGLFPAVLQARIPGAQYAAVYTPTDPMSDVEKSTFWDNIVSSIDAGFGVTVNIDAPPNNYPKAVWPDDTNPTYQGGEVLHYIAAMGYAGEGSGRRVHIADSGFWPYEYWVSFDQLATLVTPKGYVYATNPPKPKEDNSMSAQQVNEFTTAFVGPIGSDVKDIREQITGGRNAGEYSGWSAKRLINAVRDKGYDNLTLVDMMALMIYGADEDFAKARKVVEVTDDAAR